MAQKSFSVKYPIKHNGITYKKGDTVKMEPADAEYLVKRGILAQGKQDPVDANSGMPDAVIGEPKEPENAATQLTEDPGIPPEQG